MVHKKTYSLRILAILCSVMLVWNASIVSNAAGTGEIVEVPNFEIESIQYGTLLDIVGNGTTTTTLGVDTLFRFVSHLYTIPNTASGDSYIVKLRLGFLYTTSYGRGYSYDFYGDGTYSQIYFGSDYVTTINDNDIIANFTVLKSELQSLTGTTLEMEFTVDAKPGDTPIYILIPRTSTVGYGGCKFDVPPLSPGELYSTQVAIMHLTVMDFSYERVIGGDDLLTESKKQTGFLSSIFESITEFFSNFFTNLGDTVLSWIVPSADQLSDFLNEVNAWFSDRLGFIWYPFDLAIRLVNALAGGNADTTITIPALSLNMLGSNYQIWEAIEIDIDAFGIFQYVRYFTDVILVAGVAKLAYDKWDEWIGGHGVG